jgi:hypothetical protein
MFLASSTDLPTVGLKPWTKEGMISVGLNLRRHSVTSLFPEYIQQTMDKYLAIKQTGTVGEYFVETENLENTLGKLIHSR